MLSKLLVAKSRTGAWQATVVLQELTVTADTIVEEDDSEINAVTPLQAQQSPVHKSIEGDNSLSSCAGSGKEFAAISMQAIALLYAQI